MEQGIAQEGLEVDDVTGTPGARHGERSTGCGCRGDHGGDRTDGAYPDPRGVLVVDARVIPHAQRHATIFRLLAGTGVDESLILVAPHDPLPLLAQLEEREPGAFSVAYEIQGPEHWRLRLTRHR